MITYNDIYELLRKEKYSETIQPIPKKFIEEFSEYFNEKNIPGEPETNLFSESIAKSKKQLENSIALFKELILRRKKKILNLVFVATETGIMKRDQENMMPIEMKVFEKLIQNFEEYDKEISKSLNGEKSNTKPLNKMIVFTQDTEQFIDHAGETLGPFKSGELANLDAEIANILISDKKAKAIDEE